MTDYVLIEDNFLYSLKMNAIIDFNGFFNSGNEYVIKEYSIRLIRNRTNEVMDDLHRVSKPLTGWKALSKNARNRYRTYFETYGIAWKTGTHDHKFIVEELSSVLRNTRTTYLLDEDKRDMLANYLGGELNYRFEFFNEMDTDFKPDSHTECRYHEHPDKNNCANDNVSKMAEWFTAMPTDFLKGNLNIVIDFNGWYFSDEEYIIKEYAMYFIHSKTQQVISRDFQVSEAPVPWDQLDEYKLNEWKAYYRIHGIEWNLSSSDAESIKNNLKEKFRLSNKIYVRDRKKHNLLKKYLNYDFKASYLTDLNLEFKDKMTTKCKNHSQRSKNNCANDNALKMISLLSQTLNKPKLNIVIDFNGCMINNKYVVKEYSLYVVENKTYEVIRNDFEVSRPPIKKELLDKISQEKCTEYTNEFGIDWDFGIRDYETIKKHLQREFQDSYKIYVICKTKYRLLRNYLDGKLRSNFVYLKKLGFEFKPKIRTTCSYHQKSSNNNCANDNVEEMLWWLQNKKPEANNVTKIKLSGLKVPKFTRLIKRQVSNETKAEDNGSKKFKFNRATEPEDSDMTSSVPSPLKQKTASEWSLLSNSPSIPKSNSAASLIPSPPPMIQMGSAENLILNPPPMSKSKSIASLERPPLPMVNVGKLAKLDNSGTKMPAVTTVENSLEKHIIVDFYGYYFANNKYAIKEFNAIIAKESSVLDKDLYLLVKPPFPDMQKLPSELVDAYIEFEQIHSIGWNDGKDEFGTIRSTLIDYFAAATHIYVENLEKQQLLETFIDKNHNFIRLNELGFEDQPTKDSEECGNHFDHDSICARKFSKTMLQWVQKNVLNHNSPPLSVSSSLLSLLSSSSSLSNSSSLESQIPNPPIQKTASKRSLLPSPPPFPKSSSEPSSIPSPPPMPKIGSEKNVTPIPPPMLNYDNTDSSVASSSTMSESNSSTESNFMELTPNQSLLSELNNAKNRLKSTKRK